MSGKRSTDSPSSASPPDVPASTDSATWRWASLSLLDALGRMVPGVARPPAGAYHGLPADAVLGKAWVSAWLDALSRGLGLAEPPSGVDAVTLDMAESALALGEELCLHYRSEEGAATWRWVTPLRIEWRRGRLLLVAHCHLRNEERSFRLDRVQACQLAPNSLLRG